ncbi:MAG: cytochrome c biogenesis protein CcsA [Chloroflexia bacterium]|nr:cytochrome c biogenesis protein CcsA [Chloroflexia bacterium]
MEALVRLSFYCFAAASIAIAASAACYLAMAIPPLRFRSAAMATPNGAPLTAGSDPASASTFAAGAGGFATMLAWFALVFQGASVALRSLAGGRLPISNMFEFSLTFTFLILLVYLVFERWYGVRQVGAVVMPVALGMVLYVWSLPAGLREIDPLIPALQNLPLMTLHVSLAIFSYATFSVSFGAAVLYLVVSRRRIGWLPSPALLDDLAYRAVTVGFPALALVLIVGSVWAYRAWGSYWSWDPKESASLFTWLVYGVYLHTRSLRGWRGRRSAVVLLFGFAAVVFTYFGNYFFGGLHAYGGV